MNPQPLPDWVMAAKPDAYDHVWTSHDGHIWLAVWAVEGADVNAVGAIHAYLILAARLSD